MMVADDDVGPRVEEPTPISLRWQRASASIRKQDPFLLPIRHAAWAAEASLQEKRRGGKGGRAVLEPAFPRPHSTSTPPTDDAAW